MTDWIRALLANRSPQDSQEEAAISSFHAILTGSENPYDRHSFEPGHLTASALCLSPNMDALLLIFHPAFQCWIQPGGHFNPNEINPYAAAKRELLEETGLVDLEDLHHIDLDIHQVPSLKGHPSHLHGDIRFWMRATQTDTVLSGGEHPCAWVPLKDISTATTDRSVVLAVNRWFRIKKAAQSLKSEGHDPIV